MSFFEWLSKLDHDAIKLGFISVSAAVVLATWAIAAAWRAVRQSEHRTHLTTLMLERGMNAADIERVIRAAPAGAFSEDTSGDPEVRLAKHMADNHYEGGDVEKVLAAARSQGAIDETSVSLVRTLAENWAEADDIVNVLRRRKAAEAANAVAANAKPVVA